MFSYWWKHYRHVQVEKALNWIVWKLPKRLIYLASVRLMAHATTGKHNTTNPGELSTVEALRRWWGV